MRSFDPDDREFFRLDARFYTHPKILKVGPVGMAMFVAGLGYVTQHGTEGFIPEPAVKVLIDLSDLKVTADDVAEDLVGERLWEQASEGGYAIHDYRDWQFGRTRKEIISERRSEAGRKGGQTRAANDRLKHFLSKGFSEADIEVLEQRLQSRNNGEGTPVADPVAWMASILPKMQKVRRSRSTVKSIEVDGITYTFTDGQWVEA